jgi:CRISPR-associated protein Cmr3
MRVRPVTTTTTWLAVEPLDTVMVRDGRGFDAGAASVAVASMPSPSTLGGVVFQAVGDDISGHILGPIVETAADGPVFPVPGDVVRDDDGALCRLNVRKRTSGERHDADHQLTHLLTGDGEQVPGFLDADGVAEWLRADGELTPGADITPVWWDEHVSSLPWHVESRIGLALRHDGEYAGTADAGMLYAMTHLRPAEGTRLLVGCVDQAAVTVVRDLVRIGGRGRLAAVRPATGQQVLPAAPESFPGGRVAVYLATPALLADVCWSPPGARLCAVALSGPYPVASASPRQDLWQTRLLTWAVPAGTVFYLDFHGDEDSAQQWAQEHHGGLLPGQRTLRLVTAGFGTCLTGRWQCKDGC